MGISEYFPVWDKLTDEQRDVLSEAAVPKTAKKGERLHSGSSDCVGLFVIRSGRLRAFMLSDEGREVTLYRLFERDVCLFSASCMMPSIQFDVFIEAETDCELWLIPSDVYKRLMEQSAPLAVYTNELMAASFSEVMWLVEQIMWRSFDKRLATFLIEEAGIEESSCLSMTHEKIANHLGTAREVVTRMLKYFQSEGMVTLGRGEICITDRKRLEELSDK